MCILRCRVLISCIFCEKYTKNVAISEFFTFHIRKTVLYYTDTISLLRRKVRYDLEGATPNG